MIDFKKIQSQTKRLYFDNPYQVEFEAKVIERGIYEGKPFVMLDQTCFYPDSGGQPSDRGTIDGVKIIRISEEGRPISFGIVFSRAFGSWQEPSGNLKAG